MLYLRLYLVLGLLLHKLVWEVLKKKSGRETAGRKPMSLTLGLTKLAKLGILAGILLQTCLPTFLPISSQPAMLQLSGVILFTGGLAIALAARFRLGRNWSDIEAGLIRNNHAIIDSGPYRYVRHPIYVGDLLLLVGLELALNSWLVIGALVLIPIVLLKAIGEEMVLRKSLPGYEEYCQGTGRFLPRLTRRSTWSSKRWNAAGNVLIVVAIILGGVSLGVLTGQNRTADSNEASPVVYVTHAGRWYHREGCRYLARKNDRFLLKEAQARGLRPCKICKPK